ncbi:hypothetical protein B296_00016963 [Ensete ventricosum]|uniref:Uncharacterized protein n=1 Tax=Ensete ventricosum TaxID=4639 RepID=A0A426ZZA4_ENSVE|nr:hypothetical protein B296_00016963 [Ensete ventricosum]
MLRSHRGGEGVLRIGAFGGLYLSGERKASRRPHPTHHAFHSATLNPQEIYVSVIGAIPSEEEQLDSNSTRDLLWKPFGEEDIVEAKLMRLHHLASPLRSLCTITEETQKDFVSEDMRYRVGKSLRDLLLMAETPILTPLSFPPFFSSSPTPVACYSQNGFNPPFEPSDEDGLNWKWSSLPPKLKFLKDTEEKLYRKTLMEEELKDHSGSRSIKNKDIIEACASSLSPVATSSPKGSEEQNGFFITKMTPAIRRYTVLPSSPSDIKQVNMKSCSTE